MNKGNVCRLMRDQLDDIEIKIEHMIQFVNKLKMSANFRQTYHDA